MTVGAEHHALIKLGPDLLPSASIPQLGDAEVFVGIRVVELHSSDALVIATRGALTALILYGHALHLITALLHGLRPALGAAASAAIGSDNKLN